MEYIKQNFVDGQTLKADHLNHMEDGIANASGGGGSSWNDLTDKPFGDEVKTLVACKNVTVEFSEYVYWDETYYHAFIQYGDFATVTQDSKGYIKEYHVTEEDTIKVNFNGVEYEVKPILSNGELYFGNVELSFYNRESQSTDLPFYITSYSNQMEIFTTKENAGTNTITCTCEKTVTNTIGEKFIPSTIVREDDLTFKYVSTVTVPNSEIGTRLTFGCWIDDPQAIPYYTALGKYVDGDGIVHIIPVKATLSQSYAGSGTWLFTFELENEIEYDLDVMICSTHQCGFVGM